jgi:hypothetical protein
VSSNATSVEVLTTCRDDPIPRVGLPGAAPPPPWSDGNILQRAGPLS